MGATLARIESVADVRPLLARGEPLCLVEEPTQYPGNLTFLYAGDQQQFVREHIDYLSPLSMLNDVFMLRHFLHRLREDGVSVFLLPSAMGVVDNFDRWSQPLEVEGLSLPHGGELFPFQQFALRQAIEHAEHTRCKVSGFFYNFGTGCIQGDAEIVVNRGGAAKRMALRDLVYKFNGGAGKNGKTWDPSIPTYVQREVDGVVRLGRLRTAWHSGTKQTYTVTTDTGRTIRATDEHPFLTERGWLRLDELRVGDEVHVRGDQATGRPRKAKPWYREVKALHYHPHARFQGRVAYHRLVAEATLNGITVEQHIRHIRLGEVIGLKTLDPEVWAVHHIDHDHTNNSPENLEVITHEEHHRQHAHDGKTNSVLYKIATERVVSVEPYGREETYDLEVDDDPHNFIANGFVVHNTGKSVVAAAGAQELWNRGLIDRVVFFTMRKLKINMARVVEDMTQLSAIVPDGAKDKRRRQYAEGADVLVLNVEKAKFDFDELFHQLSGQRVLWVADEVQTILRGENDKNKSRAAIEGLMRVTKRSYVWPMSASVVKHSPLRYHDTFAFHTPNHNPLGHRKDFIRKYATVTKGYFGNEYTWDLDKLIEVRHLVNGHAQAVRKTDPGVRERFKGMTTQVVDVQLSRDEWALHEAIRADLEDEMSKPREEDAPPPSAAHHYALIRTMCNTPESLLASESSVAERIRNRHPELPYKQSTKFEMICDKIEEIRGAGDQVVVFTHWTHLSLFQLSRMLDERGIRHVQHYGTGMSDKQAQVAQDSFKADPDITVFLSSDAGAFGLNFTNARYVIHVEPLFDWDTFMQRSDRIDRADSYLDGLTAYVYVTDSPVEQRVWRVMNLRRQVAAITQGTVETANRLTPEELELAGMSESQAMAAALRP